MGQFSFVLLPVYGVLVTGVHILRCEVARYSGVQNPLGVMCIKSEGVLHFVAAFDRLRASSLYSIADAKLKSNQKVYFLTPVVHFTW